MTYHFVRTNTKLIIYSFIWIYLLVYLLIFIGDSIETLQKTIAAYEKGILILKHGLSIKLQGSGNQLTSCKWSVNYSKCGLSQTFVISYIFPNPQGLACTYIIVYSLSFFLVVLKFSKIFQRRGNRKFLDYLEGAGTKMEWPFVEVEELKPFADFDQQQYKNWKNSKFEKKIGGQIWAKQARIMPEIRFFAIFTSLFH